MGSVLFYIIQGLAVAFAISQAFHNAPAVDQFEHCGALDKQLATFHRYNSWAKFFFCLCISLCFHPDAADMLFGGLAGFFWIYLVFDIVLNIKRRNRQKWYYLGKNDADGRRWLKWFGKNAGKWKAVVLILCVIIVNILYAYYS